MTIDPELRQMLRDAHRSRARRAWPVRAWNSAAEWIDVATTTWRADRPQPRRPFMLLDDVRHAFRRLRSRPGTAILAAAMLALAIAVTSTMFTVADHFVVRPAPFKDPGRLVSVVVGTPGRGTVYLSPEVRNAMASTAAFAAVEGITQLPTTFLASDGLTSTSGARVTPGLFSMLGATPIMGRTFEPEEPADRAMISERLWRSAFGSDPSIIGRAINIANRPVTVIGVMPAWFAFPYGEVKVWRPMSASEPDEQVTLQLFARLAPAISVADAEDVSTRAVSTVPKFKTGERVQLRGVTAGLLDSYSRTAIIALSGGVALVFLVLCANVANLILARTNVRRVEFSVASALGASRARLLRQAFIENAMIGLVAVAGGLAAAWVLTGGALSIMPASMVMRTLNPMSVDLRAVAVASLLGFIATVAAGLPPAWIGTRINPVESLRLNSRGSTDSRESQIWTRALLVGEVALASMLLVGAGLLTMSFVRLMQVEPGLDTHSVMTASASLPAFSFADRPAVISEAETLRAHMAAMPGISAASLSYGMPPSGGMLHFSTVETDTGRSVPDLIIGSQRLGPEAFDVFGIKIIEGRAFTAGDAATDVIVGRQLATLLWPGQSAVGHSFHMGKQAYNVIGVAREVRSALSDPSEDMPEFYEPFTPGSRQVMLGMRCAGECPSADAVRQWLRSAGAGFVIGDVSSLDSKYTAQFDKPRAAATMAAIFAALALVASAGGLFSVLTYAVGRRRREFGVRVALGARPAQLQVLVVRDGLTIAATGLAIGALGAWAMSAWLSSLIYGVSTASPQVWIAVVVTLVVSTIFAAWRPARAASKADPMALLRDN
jgi:putative ABC transport system permease protein